MYVHAYFSRSLSLSFKDFYFHTFALFSHTTRIHTYTHTYTHACARAHNFIPIYDVELARFYRIGVVVTSTTLIIFFFLMIFSS